MRFYERLKIMVNNSEKLDYDKIVKYIEFNDIEKEIIERILRLNRVVSYFVSKWGNSTVYKLIISGFSLNVEKDLYAKLVVLDAIKYEKKYSVITKNTVNFDENYIVECLKTVATDELRSNYDFAKTILKINGKYFSGFSDELKNNNNIAKIALLHDNQRIPTSFLEASYDFKKNPDNALIYIEKLSRFFPAKTIYENLLQFSEKAQYIYPHDNIFIGENRNHQLQKRWLSNSTFLVKLGQIDSKFTEYIDNGDIIKYGGDSSSSFKVKSKKKNMILI